MVDSLSGRAVPGATPQAKAAAFPDPRTFAPHAYRELFTETITPWAKKPPQ